MKISMFGRAEVAMLLGVVMFGGCLSVVGEMLSLPELEKRLRDGDLIFQKSGSRQSAAIRQATGSDWTHVGVIVESGGRLRVLEAAGRGVAETSLGDFVARSNGRSVAVLRLKEAAKRFTPEVRRRFHQSLQEDYGKQYDLFFEWSDQRIYCSELVWRAYQNALGVSVGEVQMVGALEYQKPAVQALINARFQKKTGGTKKEDLLKERIITPVAMKESGLLEIVFEGTVRD